MIGIYKITSPSKRVYIGQSRNLKKRETNYSKYLKDTCGQVKLLASIRKYGWENHIFEVLEECLIEEMNEKERYWQEFYDSVENGLNCLYTRTDTKPLVMCSETRKKMSLSKTGRKLSEETRKRMSVSRKGRTFSQESRDKISKGQKRRTDIKRKVECIEDELTFDSLTEAGKYYGVSHFAIGYLCKTGTVSRKLNKTFKFVKDGIREQKEEREE